MMRPLGSSADGRALGKPPLSPRRIRIKEWMIQSSNDLLSLSSVFSGPRPTRFEDAYDFVNFSPPPPLILDADYSTLLLQKTPVTKLGKLCPQSFS
jgi:hypothetical protein